MNDSAPENTKKKSIKELLHAIHNPPKLTQWKESTMSKQEPWLQILDAMDKYTLADRALASIAVIEELNTEISMYFWENERYQDIVVDYNTVLDWYDHSIKLTVYITKDKDIDNAIDEEDLRTFLTSFGFGNVYIHPKHWTKDVETQ